jgi:hypothetical protein
MANLDHSTRLLALIAAAALAALLLLVVAAAKPAGAAFPGENGKMAFVRGVDNNSEIYVMNSDGSGTPTRLTNDPLSESKPDWGPLPDTTPPDITLTTPADGATYTVGQLVNAGTPARTKWAARDWFPVWDLCGTVIP